MAKKKRRMGGRPSRPVIALKVRRGFDEGQAICQKNFRGNFNDIMSCMDAVGAVSKAATDECIGLVERS